MFFPRVHRDIISIGYLKIFKSKVIRFNFSREIKTREGAYIIFRGTVVWDTENRLVNIIQNQGSGILDIDDSLRGNITWFGDFKRDTALIESLHFTPRKFVASVFTPRVSYDNHEIKFTKDSPHLHSLSLDTSFNHSFVMNVFSKNYLDFSKWELNETVYFPVRESSIYGEDMYNIVLSYTVVSQYKEEEGGYLSVRIAVTQLKSESVFYILVTPNYSRVFLSEEKLVTMRDPSLLLNEGFSKVKVVRSLFIKPPAIIL